MEMSIHGPAKKAHRTKPIRLRYYGFLAPSWLISTIGIIVFIYPWPRTGALLWNARLWIHHPITVIVIFGFYILWTIRSIRRTNRRAVIIGSRSIYFDVFKKRFPYGEVHIEQGGKAFIETVELARGIFPLSVFFRGKFFSSSGFLRPFGFPISDAIREMRNMPTGSINVRCR